MRYIVFAVIGAVSVILSGSVFSVAQIAGIAPDILILTIAGIVLLEKSTFPVIYAAIWGIVYDILYSTVLGMNAFAYAMAAVVLLFALRKFSRINPIMIAGAGFIAYFVKEIVLGICVVAQGADPYMAYMFIRYILPGSAICAALMFPAYLLMNKLYSNSWMRPSVRNIDDLR